MTQTKTKLTKLYIANKIVDTVYKCIRCYNSALIQSSKDIAFRAQRNRMRNFARSTFSSFVEPVVSAARKFIELYLYKCAFSEGCFCLIFYLLQRPQTI